MTYKHHIQAVRYQILAFMKDPTILLSLKFDFHLPHFQEMEVSLSNFLTFEVAYAINHKRVYRVMHDEGLVLLRQG
jgi:hypothetical protein